MRIFHGNDYPTVGIEQEFHLINPETGDLMPCVDDVLNALDEHLKSSVSYELYLTALEHQSPVFRTIDELADETVRTRQMFAEACRKVGAKLVAASSHPFADWHNIPIVPSDHYKWVMQHCAYLSKRLLSFGQHVHVGMRNVDSAMYAMNEIRRWTYPLLALSANSPYFEGQLTGLATIRAHLFGSMPRSHTPPYFRDFAELEDFYEKLFAAGDVTGPGDLWWLLRPQPDFGTVELRIFDLPTDVRRVFAFAAISQAAAAFYQDRFFDGAPVSNINQAYLEQNRWKAMRYGLDCDIIEPETGEIVSMPSQLKTLFDLIEPKAEELGSTAYISFARQMLEDGNEAQWQVRMCEELEGDLRGLELEIAERTLA